MKFSLNTFLKVLSLFTLFSVSLSTANTAKAAIADNACDPLYYESLSARAWLEAQREITQNQNLILKPDSVFEYTCFDRLVRELAVHATNMLSETSNYGTPLNSTSMDVALQNLVGTSLIAYIDNNFGSKSSSGTRYSLLSGHNTAVDSSGTAINHVPQNIATNSAPYSCEIMSEIWQKAKCMNFISNADTDGFFTFQEYTSGDDKRQLPVACTSIAPQWQENLNTALQTGPWTNDPVQTYYTDTNAQDCSGGNCPCSGDGIDTGLRVTIDGTAYDERICLQPGCRYHYGGSLGSGSASAGCYGQ